MTFLRRLVLGEQGLVVLFVLAFAAVSLLVPNFFTGRNMLGLLQSVVTIGIVAGSMMLCLASRDFDLSVGFNVAFAGMMAVMGSNATGSVALGVGLALVAGLLVGLANGVVIARLRINALIATLATLQIVRGLALIASNGRAVGVNEAGFYTIAQTSFLGIPSPVWIMVLCLAAFGFLLNRTVFGRNVLAIGGNPDATRLAGVDVARAHRNFRHPGRDVRHRGRAARLANHVGTAECRDRAGAVGDLCLRARRRVPRRRPRHHLGRGGRRADPRHRRERHEPSQHPGLLPISSTRPHPLTRRAARQPAEPNAAARLNKGAGAPDHDPSFGCIGKHG